MLLQFFIKKFDIIALSVIVFYWNFYFACRILLRIVHTFFIENDAEILREHYPWKVAFTNLIHKQNIHVKL